METGNVHYYNTIHFTRLEQKDASIVGLRKIIFDFKTWLQKIQLKLSTIIPDIVHNLKSASSLYAHDETANNGNNLIT